MCFEYNYRQAHQFFIAITRNDRVCFLNTLVYINVAYQSPKIKYQPLYKNSIKFFIIQVMTKLLRCMPSFPRYFFQSRDFCRINLIVSSFLQKFSTIQFTLDPLSTSLSLWGMMLEINTSFVVDLTLFASSVVFSSIASRDSSILRLFVPQYIMMRSDCS